MRHRVLAFQMVCILFAVLNARFVSADGLTFTEPIVKIGDIQDDSTQTVKLSYSNQSLFPIQITGTKTSCGCAIADFSKKQLDPKDIGEVKLAFKPTIGEGSMLFMVSYDQNGEAKKEIVKVTYKVTIPGKIYTNPDSGPEIAIASDASIDSQNFSFHIIRQQLDPKAKFSALKLREHPDWIEFESIAPKAINMRVPQRRDSLPAGASPTQEDYLFQGKIAVGKAKKILSKNNGNLLIQLEFNTGMPKPHNLILYPLHLKLK